MKSKVAIKKSQIKADACEIRDIRVKRDIYPDIVA